MTDKMIDDSDAVKFEIPKKKNKNGSRITIGATKALSITVDHHFNCFQKKMIKWCFGFVVEDCDEE